MMNGLIKKFPGPTQNQSNMALVMLLQTTRVGDECRPARPLVTVRSSDALGDAYARVLEANVLSAPVFDVEAGR